MLDTLDKIAHILKSEPFLIKEQIECNSELSALKGWDSLKYLTLLVEIENVLGVSLDMGKARRILTVGDLIKALQT